jgi:hypothetical protein
MKSGKRLSIKTTQSNRWISLAGLAVSLILGAFLGLFQIEAAEAHVDSGIAPAVLDVPWKTLMWDFFDPGEPDGPEDNYGGMYPPLYYVSVRAFGEVFGGEETDLRYFSFAAQMMLIVLAWLSFPVFLDERHPWLRVFLTLAVASAPAHIWWAQVTKYIHFYTFLQALSLMAAVAFFRKQSLERLGLFLLSLLAVVYTHYMGFLFTLASYAALALVLWLQKSRRALLRLVISGLIFVLGVVPLFFVILPSSQKLQNRGGFPNLYPDQAAYQPVALIRDFFIEYNYGPSITRDPGAFSRLPEAVGLALQGQPKAAAQAALPYLPLVVGVIVLGAGLILAFVGMRHGSPNLKYRAAVVALIPLFTMILSPMAGYVIYFPYIGVGTFCTFLLLVMGWARVKVPRWQISMLAAGILMVFAFSLATYYQNQDLKYPRVRPVVQFMSAHSEMYQTAILPEWLANDFNVRQEIDALPMGAEIMVVEDPLALPASQLTAPEVVVFLVGSWGDVQNQIDDYQVQNPRVQYALLESWIGLEKGNTQIHAVDFSHQ